MASPIPVLPLVASITVWPGLSSPDFSAASITPIARRSLTEPSGLNASILTNRLTPGGASLLIRTTGVLPIVSRMLWNLAMTVLAIVHKGASLYSSLPREDDRHRFDNPAATRRIFRSDRHVLHPPINSAQSLCAGAAKWLTIAFNGGWPPFSRPMSRATAGLSVTTRRARSRG